MTYKNFIRSLIIFSVFTPLEVFASSDSQKVTITLINGDVLRGNLIKSKSSNDAKVLDHPQLGELTISETKIESLKTNYTTSKEQTNNSVEADLNNSLSESDIENSKWSGSISIGLDKDIAHEDFSKSLDLDLNVDLTNEKGIYTNSISFDWTHDVSQYEVGGRFYDSNSLEIDQKTSIDISYSNLEIYFSNNYDYSSDASYGMYSTISSIGISKDFLNSEKYSLSFGLGPALHFVYGGDECDITTDCGETYLSSLFSINFFNKLSKKLKLEINNIFTSSYASTPTYGNELSASLTFKPSDSSGFKTYFKYENDFQEFSHPKFEDKYSLNVGYDF